MVSLAPAIQSAFSMSTIAAAMPVNPSDTNQNNLKSRRVSRLAGFLFGNDPSAWLNAWSVFTVLSEIGSAKSTQHFFCDQNRISRRKDGRMVDKTIGRVLSIEDEKTLNGCSKGAVAIWTWVDVDGTAGIQLCPWFMDNLQQHWDLGVYVTNDILRVARGLPTRPHQIEPPPIDLFCLLDCVILSLLTRTIPASTYLEFIVRDFAYRWNAIRQLNNGYQNADSLAFMGLGSFLIMNAGISIEANGDFTYSKA